MRAIEILKWSGTFFLVVATIIRALDGSRTLDMLSCSVGVLLWLAAGLCMRDRALVFVNGFSLLFLLYGLFT